MHPATGPFQRKAIRLATAGGSDSMGKLARGRRRRKKLGPPNQEAALSRCFKYLSAAYFFALGFLLGSLFLGSFLLGYFFLSGFLFSRFLLGSFLLGSFLLGSYFFLSCLLLSRFFLRLFFGHRTSSVNRPWRVVPLAMLPIQSSTHHSK